MMLGWLLHSHHIIFPSTISIFHPPIFTIKKSNSSTISTISSNIVPIIVPFIFIFHCSNLISISCFHHLPIHLHFHSHNSSNSFHLHYHRVLAINLASCHLVEFFLRTGSKFSSGQGVSFLQVKQKYLSYTGQVKSQVKNPLRSSEKSTWVKWKIHLGQVKNPLGSNENSTWVKWKIHLGQVKNPLG